MPLTPLHLAVGFPARKFASIKAFIIVNILIDLEPGLIMFFGMDTLGYPLHQAVHTLGGATLMAVTTVLLGIPYKGQFRTWLYGAFLGGYSHIFLDALVHSDVEPFAPIVAGNPMYLNIEPAVSIACAVVLSYYLAKWVISLRVGEVGSSLLVRFRRKFFPGSLGK